MQMKQSCPIDKNGRCSVTAVFVKGGIAKLGSEAPDESPITTVSISPFWLGEYTVTNEQFDEFIKAGGYHAPELWRDEGYRFVVENKIEEPAFYRDDRFNAPSQPATGVSFFEAEAFAHFVGGRLPTEAEWEFAGRGEDGLVYPWGEVEPTSQLANYAPDFVPVERAPSPVSRFVKNCSPFGCMQMSGNVFEWCSDYYHFDTPRLRAGANFLEARPSGRRVLKGGAWTTDADRIRLAARWSYTPDLRDNILGFRVAFDLNRFESLLESLRSEGSSKHN
jgi:gamma-glutamyl hercynylcysteine S-oxide synthase